MPPDDTMRSRVPGSRWKLRLLLTTDRWLVAAGLLASIFVALLVLLWLDPGSLSDAVTASDPIETLFQALLTAIITGVTLVVAINSLVLSQELGAVGDQRDRMEGSLEFRDDVADWLDEPVSPPEPASFLGVILEHVRQRATDLGAAVGDVDESVASAIDRYVDELVDNAADVRDDLEDHQFGTFGVISAALDFNYSLKISGGRRIQRERGEDLSEEAEAALEDVLRGLELFGPAREHVKTLYFQWELVDLSRAMLYAAVPALIVSVGAILTLPDPGSLPGTTAGFENLALVVVGATMVALLPFAILFAYILRIATVAKRTLAIGPFVLRDRGDASEQYREKE